MDRPGVSALAQDAFIFLIDCLRRAQGLRELHEQGRTREDIEGALRIMPFASPPARRFSPPAVMC